jgi:hypothetical protein
MAMSRPSTSRFSFGLLLEDAALAGVAVAAAAAVVIVVLYQSLAIGHRFPLDYGEAPLVDQAMRLAAGQNIYKPDLSAPPYTISNYPPLYVAVLAPWVGIFGPSFSEGRLLSTLCAWLAAACLAVMIHTHSRDRWAALLTGLAFITLPYVTHWSAFLRVDLLALALSLLALTVLVRWPAGRWSVVAAGLLLVASVYTRQSYALAAPLAAVVWLWFGTHSPRRALALAGLVAGLGLALFLLLQVVTSGGFFFNIVTANANEYRLDSLINHLKDLRSLAWPLIALTALALFLGPRRAPLYALAMPYVIGGALSALTIGKVGSNVNYLLELCAGLSLAAGAALAWARQFEGRRWLPAALLLLLGVQVSASARTTLLRYGGELGDRRALTNDLSRLETMVADAEGPVLADEYMGLATLAGDPLYLQPFEVTQLALAGVWDQTPLLDSLEAQHFDLVLLYDQPWSRERWTPEMLAAIDRNYRLSGRLADTKIYRPYDAQAATTSETCAGAPWRLPGEAARGLEAKPDGLWFLGGGLEGVMPVVAVADGQLTRRRDWLQAVAIEHADPLNPGETVWTYYADLGAANGRSSYIAPEFPLGSEAVPVTAGQLLGYQGSWSGRDNWPTWVHLRFAVLRGPAPGVFPEAMAAAVLLDPAPYLRLDAAVTAPGATLQPLKCAGQ